MKLKEEESTLDLEDEEGLVSCFSLSDHLTAVAQEENSCSTNKDDIPPILQHINDNSRSNISAQCPSTDESFATQTIWGL